MTAPAIKVEKRVANNTVTGEVIPVVRARFVSLKAVGFSGRYHVGWRIIIDKCPYTGQFTGTDYIGHKIPKIGELFGTMTMPETGLKARIVCEDIQAFDGEDRLKFYERIEP